MLIYKHYSLTILGIEWKLPIFSLQRHLCNATTLVTFARQITNFLFKAFDAHCWEYIRFLNPNSSQTIPVFRMSSFLGYKCWQDWLSSPQSSQRSLISDVLVFDPVSMLSPNQLWCCISVASCDRSLVSFLAASIRDSCFCWATRYPWCPFLPRDRRREVARSTAPNIS